MRENSLLRISLVLACLPLAGQIRIESVRTAAGYLPGITRAGGISTVFCTGLTMPVSTHPPVGDRLPTELAGVRVLINGVAARILAVTDAGSYRQVNFVVPALPDLTRPPITVSVAQYGNVSSTKLREEPFNGYPADFFRDTDGYGIVRRADGSLVAPRSPAQRGEIVTAYATGMGAVEAGRVEVHEESPRRPLVLYPGEGEGIKVFFCPPGANCRPQEAVSSTALFAGFDQDGDGVYQVRFAIPAEAPMGEVEMGVLRTYCYDALCALQSPFQQRFVSRTVKIAIR